MCSCRDEDWPVCIAKTKILHLNSTHFLVLLPKNRKNELKEGVRLNWPCLKAPIV